MAANVILWILIPIFGLMAIQMLIDILKDLFNRETRKEAIKGWGLFLGSITLTVIVPGEIMYWLWTSSKTYGDIAVGLFVLFWVGVLGIGVRPRR